MSRLVVVLALLCAGLVTAPGAAGSEARDRASYQRADRVELRLRTAVRRLPERRETPVGYEREKFRHWIDANGDCQDTRDEVLDAESRVATGGCDITEGRWFSYYDKRTWDEPADVDIDHVVALKEAWDSGAKRWNANTRTRYANDLHDRRALVAVTDNVNQSKSDQDPADWLPQYQRCRFVREWTAVKLRWRLAANPAEKRALVRLGDGCANRVIRVTRAAIR